jgi:leucine dehydrogenase
MSIFQSADFDGHEEVLFVQDLNSGLRAIIAIHNTNRGPALGGCRMYPYANEADAIRDVLRLSRGMSYKAALAGVALGGGKSVILGDPYTQKTPALLLSMGRAIERLGGRYITGEDVGTNPQDMAVMRKETRAVSCLSESEGGYGDPAPFTALGVVQAIKAGAAFVWGSEKMEALTIAIQGVGNVGWSLCQQLHGQGARLIVCDPHEPNVARARALGARIVAPEAIYAVEADVFAPCAMGGTLNSVTIPKLKVRLIAGAANNQLFSDSDAALLKSRGILYIPDYVANGGGLISCAAEWYRTPKPNVHREVLRIRDACIEIIEQAALHDKTTLETADQMAQTSIGAAKE